MFAFLFQLSIQSLFCWLLILFVVISKLCLEFPYFNRKRNAAARMGKRLGIQVIAHRGSRSEGLPENTISAFNDAIAAGTDVIELDVWLTADKRVVVHHDKCLTRMTSGKNTTLISEIVHCDMPKLVPNNGQIERIHEIEKESHWNSIPELWEVLEAVTPSKVCMIIEFKQESDELIGKVKDLLYHYGYSQNVFWFSLIEKINCKLRLADPSIPTITSVIGMVRILGLYYIGLLPFVDIPNDVLGLTIDTIPLSRVQNEAALKHLPSFVHYLLAFLLQGTPPALMMAPSLFRHLRNRGIPVWFMNVNSDAELLAASKIGATAVLTDRIRWLVGSIKKQNIKFMKVST